ncbi:MAG: hypothetical protein L7T80_05095, partial [Arenicellales bacterium]|nr:hypothetical protein [Arenicellales bacterium]
INHAPRGRHGGENGAVARVYIKEGGTLKGMGRETIPAGQTMVLETAGGGGRGDASDRDAELIAQDFLDELSMT